MKEIAVINFSCLPRADATVPLGPLYILSALEANLVPNEFFDTQLASNPQNLSGPLNDIIAHADIIALSCLSSVSLPSLLIMTQEIRDRYPTKLIVIGGQGSSGAAQKIITEFTTIDGIVIGDGMLGLIDLSRGASIGNIRAHVVYKEGKNVCIRRNRHGEIPLDKIPVPAYHHIDYAMYRRTGIILSSGCTRKCGFCVTRPIWGTARYRNIQSIATELLHLRSTYACKNFDVFDEALFLNDWLRHEFCQLLLDLSIDLRWRCYGTIAPLEIASMKNMAKAGCHTVFFTVGSGSDEILAKLNCAYTSKDAVELLVAATNYFESVYCYVLFGYPYEDINAFYDTLLFATLLAEKGVNTTFKLASPFGMAPFYNDSDETPFHFVPQFVEQMLEGFSEKQLPHNAIDMIKAYPTIFPEFHTVDIDNIQRKLAMLTRRDEVKLSSYHWQAISF